MYKPANIREFITPAVHKKPVYNPTSTRAAKSNYEVVGNVRGKFKLKGTAEITANGATVINDKTSFITWYKPDYAAADILTINGIDYEIKGTPENVEMRGRYSVLILERIGGGA